MNDILRFPIECVCATIKRKAKFDTNVANLFIQLTIRKKLVSFSVNKKLIKRERDLKQLK